MPRISPLGGEVNWPTYEGAIGVVGVAPWATLDFLRTLYFRVDATKDWHFPRVIADINTKLPSRGRHLELGERDPSPFIAESIYELATQGATIVVVPCNTAHILYARWAKDAPVAVPHIVEVTVAAIRSQGATRVATLASRAVSSCRLYEDKIVERGMDVLPLSDAQVNLVQDVIQAIKIHGVMDDHLATQAKGVISELQTTGADGLILGCTELASLQTICEELGLSCAESNAALAEHVLIAARARMK